MTPGHRLRVIRYAAWYHCSIGVSLGALLVLGFPIPKPWDALDAYTQFIPVWATAGLFIISAILSICALTFRGQVPWLLGPGVVPQQLLILWAAVLTSVDLVFHDFQPRTWLSLLPVVGLAYFHGREISEVWQFVFASWRGRV